MAEIVSSAVTEQIVNQILSSMIDRHERKPSEEHLERLEMARIKLKAALETSDKWQINDASLLRWRRKLKRAAQECDDTLRSCKQRAVEDEEKQRVVRCSSFPRRLAHITKSFVSSIFSGCNSNDEYGSSSPAVRRFEWFADGATEFLTFVELGGTPRRYMFFDPLIAHLLAGEELRYRLIQGSQYQLFCVRPISLEDRGIEAKLIFIYEDDEAPDKNLCIGSMLRLSESTDIVGITIKCLQFLVTPHFKSTAEAATRELANLPTQDFSWVPYADSSHKEHWNSIHRDMSQWFRPDPLCCNQHEARTPCGNSTGTTRLSEVPLESVIEVYWQCEIPLSESNMQRSPTVEGRTSSTKDIPRVKLGLLFTPHGSLGDVMPKTESSALEVMNGEEQHGMHTNISLQQLDEIMVPKAIDCLYQKAEATAYQILWTSKHGHAYFQMKKTMPLKNIRGGQNKRSLMQRYHQDPKLERWTHVLTVFLNLWVARAPYRLRRSMVEWMQKANEKQLDVKGK
ncbi:uncharacterized protein LOC133910619 [Phragmites australis]|uniref:uncharacterized protein LOC133910619 n=1 Tax=Phragmites australis TaxID=29695 RepID=UPI002D769769|nr:uncharacterized protein LOC133910619 [Phragmites australis]